MSELNILNQEIYFWKFHLSTNIGSFYSLYLIFYN